MGRVAPNLPKSWHWYICNIFVLHVALMFVFNIFLVTVTTLLMSSLASRILILKKWCGGRSSTGKHPCMAIASLHSHLMQLRYHGVTKSIHRTYQAGLIRSLRTCFSAPILTLYHPLILYTVNLC